VRRRELVKQVPAKAGALEKERRVHLLNLEDREVGRLLRQSAARENRSVGRKKSRRLHRLVRNNSVSYNSGSDKNPGPLSHKRWFLQRQLCQLQFD
jgi:hypothetical protein